MKSNLEPIEERDLDLEGKMKRADAGISPEQQKESPYQIEKETAQEISAAEKDDSYGQILSKVQSQVNDIDPLAVANDAKTGAAKMDAETQVQHLVDLASQKGVVHAVKVAQHMQDNYVLDTFHDKLLSQELHDALIKKGLIKEI